MMSSLAARLRMFMRAASCGDSRISMPRRQKSARAASTRRPTNGEATACVPARVGEGAPVRGGSGDAGGDTTVLQGIGTLGPLRYRSILAPERERGDRECRRPSSKAWLNA